MLSSQWSEKIQHDRSAKCPVEDGAVVRISQSGITHIASELHWELVEWYEIKKGWSRPLADIFAELPDEAEWIICGSLGLTCWSPVEPLAGRQKDVQIPSAMEWNWLANAKYFGDWRESKRKRPDAAGFIGDEFVPPEPELPEIERVGQARAKAQMKAKPAPWFVVVGFPDGGAMFTHCETREAADEIAIAEAKDGNEAFVCRAVASFTAKVERTTYENGGE